MKTIKEVAEICGMSKTSVNRAIDELKIEKVLSGNKNLVSDADADRIVSLLRGYGKTCEEIETNQSNSTQNQTETQQNNPKSSESSSSVTSETLQNNDILINFLMEQIKVKDNQISELQEENRMLIQAQAFTVKQLEKFANPELTDTQKQGPLYPDDTSAEPHTSGENDRRPKERRFRFWNRK